jgi:flagellar motility protein MotE (MotC chaperone)
MTWRAKDLLSLVLVISVLLFGGMKGIPRVFGVTPPVGTAGQPEKSPSEDERRILLMRQDLEKEIELNRKLLGKIEKKLALYRELKKKSVQNLISIYESMAPRTAALQIDAMPKNLRLTLFSGMDPRKASRIMRYVEPRVAAEISAQMAEEPQLSGGRQ